MQSGDQVTGKFPTHGVLWSTEHGWHKPELDAQRCRTGQRSAMPATEGKLIELHDDGSATVEVAGRWDVDRGVRKYTEPERVRVPDLEHAERHEENPPWSQVSRTQIGPHWNAR